MKIRNTKTGETYEVVKGTLYPSFFEEVKEEKVKAKNTADEKENADGAEGDGAPKTADEVHDDVAQSAEKAADEKQPEPKDKVKAPKEGKKGK